MSVCEIVFWWLLIDTGYKAWMVQFLTSRLYCRLDGWLDFSDGLSFLCDICFCYIVTLLSSDDSLDHFLLFLWDRLGTAGVVVGAACLTSFFLQEWLVYVLFPMPP
jgi:hypothetical protein